MKNLEQDEMLIEAKNFFNAYRNEIRNSIKNNEKIVHIDFKVLSELSPTLSERLILNPQEVLALFEVALEELGLIQNAKILLKNTPPSTLTSEDLYHLVCIKAHILEIGKLKHRIVSSTFECPSCGAILSVLQVGDKFKEPTRCSCGRRGGFKLMNKEFRDYKPVKIRADNDEELFVDFYTLFFQQEYNDILKEGNIIRVGGILTESMPSDKLDIEFRIIPLNLELVNSSEHPTQDAEELLNSMKSLGHKGAFIFEEFIGRLFEKKGYKTKVTKKTGDFGIDVIAEKPKEKIAIQCKLNDRDIKVPNTAIQKALGAIVSPYEADKLIFITTSKEYTSQALEQVKKAKLPIELWDRFRLIAEIKAFMQDLEEGWELLDNSQKESILSKEELPNNLTFPFESILEPSTETKSKISYLKSQLLLLESKLGKLIPLDEVWKAMESKMNLEEFNEAIERLKRLGEIFMPRKGFIQRM